MARCCTKHFSGLLDVESCMVRLFLIFCKQESALGQTISAAVLAVGRFIFDA